MNKAEELRKIADAKRFELDELFLKNIKEDRKYLKVLKEVEEAANNGFREKKFNFSYNDRLKEWEINDIKRALSLQGFYVKTDSYGFTNVSF